MRERLRFEYELRDLNSAGGFAFGDYENFDPGKVAAELQPIFRAKFSFQKKGVKNKILYGAKVGGNVLVEMLAEKDFAKEWLEEKKRRADGLEKLLLKFAPELIRDELVKYYAVLKQKLPERLNIIDENTKLDRDERAILFSLIKVMWLAKADEEISKLEGFYSQSRDKIVIKDSTASVAVLAHEMAHAYADRSWQDFTSMMILRKMKNANELDEGMATVIERIVVNEWVKKQADKKLTPPPAAYDTKTAQEFIKLHGEKTFYESYFAGEVDFTDNDKPEDSLRLGKSRKKWKWKWR